MRDLRQELRDAVRDVRREERRAGRHSRAPEEAGGDATDSLRAELATFVGDVIGGVDARRLDSDALDRVRAALLDARRAIAQALTATPSDVPT